MPIIAKNTAGLTTRKVDSYSKKIIVENTDLLMLVSEDTLYNISAQDLLNYIKVHPDISSLYITKEELSDELYQKLDKTQKGAANGMASLDENGKVPESQLDLTSITAGIDNIEGIITENKPVWDDKYTKNEVDNKFSVLETSIDWKESVATYNDLAVSYPVPDDGWTVNVRDTDYTYRWNGTSWISISANSIPKATQDIDGLLSREDKINYDDANAKKHSHSNKTVLDTITQGTLDNLFGAYAHTGDAVKHITSSERTLWNTVTGKVDKVTGKQLSTNDYTTAEKNKLAGITADAERNVQPDWNVSDTSADSYIKNKPVIPNIPGALKNPYALKANGKTYDGSGEVDMGTVGLAYGGTGAATAAAARTNLGLGASATQAVANNLTTAAAGSVLDARQGKLLNDNIVQINTNITGLKENKLNKSDKGIPNGLASLNSAGKIPNEQLEIATTEEIISILNN